MDSKRSKRRLIARIIAGGMFGVAGFLGVTSSLSAGGTDLRAERQTDLADLVRAQVQRNQGLVEDSDRLSDQIASLSKGVAGVDLEGAQRKQTEVGAKLGLTSVRGPGLTVTLDDAPSGMRNISNDHDALVVHQQDIQSVANALWAGGAEALTIQGQRVISTTAIRCVGNSVVVQGVPYPPPYVISAVGDIEGMKQALNQAPGVLAYLDDVDRYQLTYQLEPSDRLDMPAYRGSLDLAYATPDDKQDPER